MWTVPAAIDESSNEPVIIAENPIRVNAPITAISMSDWIMTGMCMLRILFAVYPRIAPITAARIMATTGAATPNCVAKSIAMIPEPNAIIPAEGTPVPIP